MNIFDEGYNFMMVCYRCRGPLTYTQHPWGYRTITIDCPRCGPDQRAVEILESANQSLEPTPEPSVDGWTRDTG